MRKSALIAAGVKIPGAPGALNLEQVEAANLIAQTADDTPGLGAGKPQVVAPIPPRLWHGLPGDGDGVALVGIKPSDPPEPDDGIPRSRVTRTCRRYTARALRALIADLDSPWPQHRREAALAVLAYGWGKPAPRPMEDTDAERKPEQTAAQLREVLREEAAALGLLPALDVTPQAVKA